MCSLACPEPIFKAKQILCAPIEKLQTFYPGILKAFFGEIFLLQNFWSRDSSGGSSAGRVVTVGLCCIQVSLARDPRHFYIFTVRHLQINDVGSECSKSVSKATLPPELCQAGSLTGALSRHQ